MTPSASAKPIKIAVNVMRSRLTIIGFNIAVASFQIDHLNGATAGDALGLQQALHASSHISLLLAIALSMAAMVSYVYSSEYDQVGTCTSWHIIAGDLLMYCGLAATLAGFFAPIESSLNLMLAGKDALSIHFDFLQTAILFVGSVSWFMATYIGPLHALSRSPFPRKNNIALAIGYLLLLSGLAGITATAAAIDMNDPTRVSVAQWLTEFVQPIRW
ncbi:hypothetical protein [Shewanella sp. UCD-KL21]|uniref:hypothetical protein n=1 Tax=Shewanella sp. UCD-KL21 TaxID=1917164 RepID=UPI00097047D3|nr:hypothetical protein [Shewanella sp. UCD-KL21]